MMKKSILATLLAGLVSLGVAAGGEPHMMKLQIEKDDNGPTVINVEENGQDYEFSFTDAELKDEALLADSLQALDERTRKAVIKALTATAAGGGNMIFIDKDEIHGGDGEHEMVVVKEFKYNSEDVDDGHRVVIKVDGAQDGEVAHKIIESADGRGFAFKIGPDADKIEWHHDGKHMGKVLEKLLKNSELTPEQVEKLQQLLDEKRK